MEAKHRITRILTVLKIPRTTYYEYLNWKPSDRMIRRQKIKEKLTIPVSHYLIYRIMRELGIQSKMIKKLKKTKSYTEVDQLPNLIKKKND